MKAARTTITPVGASRWLWILLFSCLHTLHTVDWCAHAMGSSANGVTGPWGIHSRRHICGNKLHRKSRKTILPPPLLDHNHRTAIAGLPRGGYEPMQSFESPNPSSSFVRVLGTITQLLISMGRFVLPTLVGTVKGVVSFYRALPIDAITAQIGLVYCFLGGYYPTLFSSLQAAKYCGWRIAVRAISDLTDEALAVMDELEDAGFYDDSFGNEHHIKKNMLFQQTHIVLKTVDPQKINVAASALYTTWLGISAVLRREYARVINLSLTLAEGIETAGNILLAPALKLVTPKDYQKWVPVLLGWAAKAASMRIAWRIERVLTAATSAIAGGAMVARSLTKLWRKRRETRQDRKARRRQRRAESSLVVAELGPNKYADIQYSDDGYVEDDEADLSIGEQVVGFAVGGLGFYTQVETQLQNKFSFVVPFPLSLLTWPFDLAERWIQWYITEKAPP